jgi:hypothetical protein
MKREILFRGYSESLNKWVEGGIYTHEGEVTIIHKQGNNLMHNTPVHPDSVGQLTGLMDCNGVRIFEGDKVTPMGRTELSTKIDTRLPLHKWHYVIFKEGAFKITKTTKTARHSLTGLLIRAYQLQITGNTFKPE